MGTSSHSKYRRLFSWRCGLFFSILACVLFALANFPFSAPAVAQPDISATKGKKIAVEWRPRRVVERLVAGSSETVSVRLKLLKDFKRLKFSVPRQLRPLVKVSPATIRNAKKGGSVSLKLRIKTSVDTRPRAYLGKIRAKERKGKRWRTLKKSLQVRVVVLPPDTTPPLVAITSPVDGATVRTFQNHLDLIVQRWSSTHSNARLEGLNGLFQAARARARGYRNTATFISMIYLIAAPIGDICNST